MGRVVGIGVGKGSTYCVLLAETTIDDELEVSTGERAALYRQSRDVFGGKKRSILDIPRRTICRVGSGLPLFGWEASQQASTRYSSAKE